MTQAKAKAGRIKARDHRGRSTRTPETIAQDLKAAELRSKSWSYSQIGAELGLSTTSAFEAVHRGIREIPTEGAEEARRIEVAKLDALERVGWNVLEAMHFVMIESGPRAGEIIYHPERPGEPLENAEPVLAAIDRILKAGKRRAELLGLDAPKQSVVNVVTTDMVDMEIQKLEAQLARNDHSSAAGEAEAPTGVEAASS